MALGGHIHGVVYSTYAGFRLMYINKGYAGVTPMITIVDCREYPNSCCTYSLYAISFYDHLLNFFCVQIHDRSETHIEKFEITANRGQGTRD